MIACPICACMIRVLSRVGNLAYGTPAAVGVHAQVDAPIASKILPRSISITFCRLMKTPTARAASAVNAGASRGICIIVAEFTELRFELRLVMAAGQFDGTAGAAL